MSNARHQEGEEPLQTGRPFASEQGALNVVDGSTMTLRATIPLGRETFTVREAPGGRTVCVANSASDTISVVDTATFDVVQTLSVTPQPGQVPIGGPHGLAFFD